MYLLMFMEAGNVWRDFEHFEDGIGSVLDLNRSVGFGGRVFMPMLGILGYDVGYGMDIDTETYPNISPWQYHFIFGVPF